MTPHEGDTTERSTRGWVAVASSLLVLACGGATAATPPASTGEPSSGEATSPRYPIRTDRPERVGQRWRLHAHGRESSSSRIVADGAPSEPGRLEAVELDLTAVVTILEVDANGRQLRVRYEVESLVSTDDGGSRPLVAPGTVMTVARGEEPVVHVGEERAPEELAELLDLVMEMGVDRDDDEVFGSTEPRAVGDSWSLDTVSARRGLAEVGIATDDLAGQMHVEALVVVDSEPCLDLRGHMTIHGLELPALPEGARALDASMHMVFEGVFPIDTTRHERSERTKMTTTVDVQIGPTRLHTVQMREVRRTFEPLPDAP